MNRTAQLMICGLAFSGNSLSQPPARVLRATRRPIDRRSTKTTTAGLGFQRRSIALLDRDALPAGNNGLKIHYEHFTPKQSNAK